MKIKYIPTNLERNKATNTLVKSNFPHLISEKTPDLILVLGGDGTFLHSIQKYGYLKKPFLGIAGGTLNFLMNNISDVVTFIEDLQANKVKLQTIKTNSIKVTLLKKSGRQELLGYAINEVVIGSNVMGYHNFSITTSSGSFRDLNIKGSGVCVSTDIGSTGYNFNLGGPVIPLGSNIWSLNGVVCNSYLNDIVEQQKIIFSFLDNRKYPYVFIDGIRIPKRFTLGDRLALDVGKQIEISFIDKSSFLNRRFEVASRYRR